MLSFRRSQWLFLQVDHGVAGAQAHVHKLLTTVAGRAGFGVGSHRIHYHLGLSAGTSFALRTFTI